MNIKFLISQIEKIQGIDSADADFIPSSSVPSPAGDHFFINCAYNNSLVNQPADLLLDKIRIDARNILEMAVAFLKQRTIKLICLSFYKVNLNSNNLRLYRTVLTSSNISNLYQRGLRACSIEESDLPSISEILLAP